MALLLFFFGFYQNPIAILTVKIVSKCMTIVRWESYLCIIAFMRVNPTVRTLRH